MSCALTSLSACWSSAPPPDPAPPLTPVGTPAPDPLGPPIFALVGHGARITFPPPVRLTRAEPSEGAQAVVVDAAGQPFTFHPPSQLQPTVPGNERRATSTLVWLECAPASCDAIEPLATVEASPDVDAWHLELGRVRLPWYEAGSATAPGDEDPRVELSTEGGSVFAIYRAPAQASVLPDLTAVIGDAQELARGGTEPLPWADVAVADTRERRFRVALPEDIVVVATYPGITDDILGQDVWGFTDDARQIGLSQGPPPPAPAPDPAPHDPSEP